MKSVPYKRQRKGKVHLLFKPGSLSSRTDVSGQTSQDRPPTSLFYPFSLPAGTVPQGPGFFSASKCSIAFGHCSAGTCFCWELGDVAILCGNLHIPIINLINNNNKRNLPTNEQSVMSELPSREITSFSPLGLTRFGHVAVDVTKTQEGSADGHVRAIIHVLTLCVPLHWQNLTSLLYLCFMGNYGIFSDYSRPCMFLSH